MRGGFIPQHYTLSLSQKEGETLQNLAVVIRAAHRDGQFGLQEDEDELLEDLVQRLEVD